MSDGLQLLGDHLAGRIALPQRLDVDAVPEHTGVLLVDARAIPADMHALWWIDLASGDSGRVQRARSAREIVRNSNSSAAWLLQVRDDEGRVPCSSSERSPASSRHSLRSSTCVPSRPMVVVR